MAHDEHDEHSHEHGKHDHEHGEHMHAQRPGAPIRPHSDPVAEHRADSQVKVSMYLVTCSDTRDLAHDESGGVMRALAEGAGHTIVGQAVIRDEAESIRAEIEKALGLGARMVAISGGTGLARRDVTVETVTAMFEKKLEGFGELFRMLSYRQIGAAAMLSRAVAGTVRGAIVFALPGSPGAVELAFEELILPELGHLVRELSR